MIEFQDSNARSQAIDPCGSYAVSAPAGSGKTELLIQRTLSVLSTVEHPEGILGITYTRKAANEMRERVVKALGKALINEPVSSSHEQQTRQLATAVLRRNDELGWNLLANPSRLRFQTIDGLCRQLANQLCLETGIVVPPSMSEDSKALYQKAAGKTLEFMDAKGPTGAALRVLVEHLDGNLEKLVELIADLLCSRDSWLPIIIPGEISQDYLQERVEALVEETLVDVGGAIAPYSSRIESLLDYALLHKEGASQQHPATHNHIPEPEASELSKWKALRAFLLTGAGTFRSRVTVANGFPTESEHASKAEARARKAEFAELIAALKQGGQKEQEEQILAQLNRLAILPDLQSADSGSLSSGSLGSDSTETIHQAIFSLLPIAAAAFNTLSQEMGETDFTAVAIAAIEALGQPDEPTPLALRLDYRIQHILVDEFQDTSGVQIDLLKRLTAGWQPDDGRTLFIVGDGMQSIYGFRKANVSLFIRARREGIGDIQITPLDLTANFRSDKQIVDWINQSFSELFPPIDNLVQGQVAFKPSEPTKNNSDWKIDLAGFANTTHEAEAIAEDIEQKLLKGENDLAILVRGRRHLEAILPALRARKIQWQAQDIDPLANRMAVMDVHSLTRALCVPADRLAWLAILRAPWAGLNMADLLHLCEWSPEQGAESKPGFPPIWCALAAGANGIENPIANISVEGANTVKRLAKCFEAAFEQFGRQPLRQIIEQLWKTLDAPEALLEPRDLQDAEDYLNLLEQVESGGMIVDWQAFQRRLDDLYAKPEHSKERNDNSDVRLQIMTIHKSKGLEFDHVYLPSLGRTTRQNNEPLLLWWQREYEDGSEGYLLAAKPSQTDKRLENKDRQSLYMYLKAEESERQRQETARLLYVACTRARKSLFLTASLHWDDKQEQVKKPASNSMLAILWDLYEEQFVKDFQPVFEDEEEQLAILDGIRRLPTDRPIACLEHEGPVSQKSIESNEPQKIHSYEFNDNYFARISGDLIHHSLMRVVREKITNPASAGFINDWLKGTCGIGLREKQQQAIIIKLEQMLEAILADKTGRWLLDSTHKESAAELEIDYLDSRGSVQLAIIDRTFVEGSTRWIVDYKSSTPKEGESVKQFLQLEAETYQPQMKRYLSLFDAPEKRALLYFPAISTSIEIEHLYLYTCFN